MATDYLEWNNIRLNKSDIVDFKHGMNWIVWYKFTVGRNFSITLKDGKNKELKIRFSSYFGLNRENTQTYSGIVDNIWRLYHSDIVDGFLHIFYSEEEIEIQGIKLKNDGVELRGKARFVTWDKVAVKDYSRYFAIYNRDNSEIHSRVSYNEYGTETLWSLIRTILKEKEMNASQ